ncbi:MAG: hypothetical protein C0593_11535 [Marinilabiliales bacterium]|nr:MAG: hypothetical protein C0593_11535 [Marinilabiliales bacterium]
MKKHIKHITLFLLPILLIIIVMPVNNRMRYLELSRDCSNRGIWIHDRIFENDSKIDIAFLGSSHTINGINDELISKAKGKSCVNLGYCRLGRNLHYVIAKNVIHEKHPKLIVLEVRVRENRYSHPVFPFMANTKDALMPCPFFNKDIFSDMFTHLSFKIEVLQDLLFKEYQFKPVSTELFGYASHPDTANSNSLQWFYSERHKSRKLPSNALMQFYNKYPYAYLKKIKKLCDKNDTELTFLFIPPYGVPDTIPDEIDFYMKYGKTIIPPQYIFNNKDLWYDENHLNEAGAQKFTEWLSHQDL